MKKTNENYLIATYISTFLYDYAPNFLTQSKDTLKAYEDTLRVYVFFLEYIGIKPSILNHRYFEQTYIEQWIIWLQSERKCSPATCNIRLGLLRTFIAYLGRQNIGLLYLYQDAKQIRTLKSPKNKVHGISKEGIELLFRLPNLRTKTGRRDFTLLMLMYSIAARMNEVLSIRIKDLHLEEKEPFITLYGKGNKTRPAYLLPRVLTNIKGYILEFHGKNPNPEDYLFFSRIGEGKNKITQVAINKRIKMYAEIAHKQNSSIPESLHAHQLRHAKASHWLADNMNIVQIQFLLGHETLETTMKYLDVSPEMKLDALTTIETEKERAMPKKWKASNADISLTEFLGFEQ